MTLTGKCSAAAASEKRANRSLSPPPLGSLTGAATSAAISASQASARGFGSERTAATMVPTLKKAAAT